MNEIIIVERVLRWCDAHGRILMQLSFLSVYCFLFFNHWQSGLVLSPDSDDYIIWADQLTALDFNLKRFYQVSQFEGYSPFFYTVPVLVIAILKQLFLENWQLTFFFLNLAMLFAIQYLLAKCLILCGARYLIVALAMPLLLISADFMTWPRYLLTDMFFATFVMVAVYYILRCRLNQPPFFLPLLLIISVITITRPTSLAVIFASAISLLVPTVFPLVTRAKVLSVILISGVLVSALLYGVLIYILQSASWSHSSVEYLLQWVNQGVVVHDRPDTWVSMPESWYDFVILFLARFAAFFSPIATTFSLSHNIANILLLGIFMSGLTIWFFLEDKGAREFDEIAWVTLILSSVVACYHSATLIDFDWRYRFPIIAPLIVFGMTGWEYLLRYILKEPSR